MSETIEPIPENGSIPSELVGLGKRLSYSTQHPQLQTAWDSTSIGIGKECWYKYKLAINEGWTAPEDSVHLDFGTFFHSATESYDRAKARGESNEVALEVAVDRGLTDTWNPALQRPWASTDPNKNRANLIRSIVWYYQQYQDDNMQTLILANGKPAVELSFSFDIGYKSRITGEPFLLCGHFDRIVEFLGDPWVEDKKTTKYALNSAYFAKFSPDNQVSCYSLSGRMVFKIPLEGVVITGVQVLKTLTRAQRGFIPRSESSLNEWLHNLYRFFEEYETNIERNQWVQNDKSCGVPKLDEQTGELRYGCQFRGICSKSPEMREIHLKAGFKKRFWDPLKTREVP